MDFNQTGSTNLTVGWRQERWGIFLFEETIDYKVKVFERNSSEPVREVNASVEACSSELRRVTVDGLKENTEYSVRVVSRVRCSNYESAPATIQLTTLDGVPLANPTSEPGSYEWIETSPACRIQVYWAHPPLETVRGQLEATRVELLDSSWAQSSAEDVPANRTHKTLYISTSYCSSSAPIDLWVALRTMSRSGPNNTLAPTVLHIRPPQAMRINMNRSSIHVRCQSYATDSTCSVLAAAVLLQPSGHMSSNLLRTAVVSRLLMCSKNRNGNEPDILVCNYVNDCDTRERTFDDLQQISLHVFCTLSPTLTVVQMRNLKIGAEISWNSTKNQEFLNHKFEPISIFLSRAKPRISSSGSITILKETATNSLETSPLQWGTCHEATLGTPALCPRPPEVLLDSLTPEPYDFFKSYRVKIRWRSRNFECITSSNETIPMYYELNWKSAPDTHFSISSQCEDANKSVNDFPQVGQRIVAQVGLSQEMKYESEWIPGLEPSLFGGGARYRIDLFVHDVFGSRVTRVTFALAVVGWSRLLVIAAIVGVVLVAVLLVALILVSGALTCHYRGARRLAKKDDKKLSHKENEKTESQPNDGNCLEMGLLNNDYYKKVEVEQIGNFCNFVDEQLKPSESVAQTNRQLSTLNRQ